MDKKTILYYENNKNSFKESTQTLDFTEIQDLFLSYLKPQSKILDFGCGAGRDTKYFLNKGYKVDALDGSPSMCKIASDYCQIDVKNILFEDYIPQVEYDGIWACSSLLHIPFKNLNSIFSKLHKSLKNKGILYVSFKLGTFEGYRNNRYFTDLTFDKLFKLPEIKTNFRILKHFISTDIRKNRENEKWLNVILQKI